MQICAQKKCIFLGLDVSSDGIRPPPDRTELLRDYAIPTHRKELKIALGMFNWFRKCIPHYSIVACPLYHLLKKDVPYHWTNECIEFLDA